MHNWKPHYVRSPTYKRSYNRGSTSPQKVQRREEKKSEEMKKDLKIEENDENLYQPPTPEENVVAVEAESENCKLDHVFVGIF